LASNTPELLGRFLIWIKHLAYQEAINGRTFAFARLLRTTEPGGAIAIQAL